MDNITESCNVYKIRRTWKLAQTKFVFQSSFNYYVNGSQFYAPLLYGNLTGRNHLHDLEVEGKNKSNVDRKEIEWKDVDWIHLAKG
jgi:hypothetical protein